MLGLCTMEIFFKLGHCTVEIIFKIGLGMEEIT